MSNLRGRFVAAFGEHLAVSVEAAIERHVPALKVSLERGSDPFRFALVWAVGLECMSRPEFRAEHGVSVPWEMLRDWIRGADLLAGYDGTFDVGGLSVGLFDGILGRPDADDVAAGRVAGAQWVLATVGAVDA